MDNFLPSEIANLRKTGDDIYVENKMSIESYFKILETQEEMADEEHIAKMQTPTLMILGENDKHSDNTKSQELFDQMKNLKYKRSITIPEGDHYMMNWEHSYEEV